MDVRETPGVTVEILFSGIIEYLNLGYLKLKDLEDLLDLGKKMASLKERGQESDRITFEKIKKILSLEDNIKDFLKNLLKFLKENFLNHTLLDSEKSLLSEYIIDELGEENEGATLSIEILFNDNTKGKLLLIFTKEGIILLPSRKDIILNKEGEILKGSITDIGYLIIRMIIEQFSIIDVKLINEGTTIYEKKLNHTF